MPRQIKRQTIGFNRPQMLTFSSPGMADKNGSSTFRPPYRASLVGHVVLASRGLQSSVEVFLARESNICLRELILLLQLLDTKPAQLLLNVEFRGHLKNKITEIKRSHILLKTMLQTHRAQDGVRVNFKEGARRFMRALRP